MKVVRVKSLIKIRWRLRLRIWAGEWVFALRANWRHPRRARASFRQLSAELERDLGRRLLGL